MTRVTIRQGELQGVLDETITGKKFASFKGIPYAKPPVGEYRFKAPLPAEKWDGVRDASQHGNSCVQWDILGNSLLEGSEDCLTLNVYSPNINGPLRPVMVWFHGGAFVFGSADDSIYGAKYLMDQGVVLVTVNYRLEVLGFLCLDHEDVPGNAGMKDQVMALRWVRDNILKFGGDPGNVTIFGESAGSVSVSLHLVSPMSKGLFHRAILQSGCFFNEWALSENAVERGFRMGKHLGKDTTDVNELIRFLKNIPAAKLVNMVLHISDKSDNEKALPLLFCPSVEKSFKNQESFLPKSPMELLNDGDFSKVPIIIGYTDIEGVISIQKTLERASMYEKNFNFKLPPSIRNRASPELQSKLASRMKKFYFGDQKISEETILNAIDMDSDYLFVYGVQKFAKTFAKISPRPVYLYKFTADTHNNVAKTWFNFAHIKGAAHGDDMFYLFNNIIVNVDEKSESWSTIKNLTKLWTNFATFSNPTPIIETEIALKWNPIVSDSMNYLDIGLELKTGVNPDKERYEFHDKMYEEVANEKQTIRSSL